MAGNTDLRVNFSRSYLLLIAFRTLAFITIGLWPALPSDAASAQQPSAKAIYDCSWFAVATLTKCPLDTVDAFEVHELFEGLFERRRL
jgi:hypothetical protein